jgi:hypothetical protein
LLEIDIVLQTLLDVRGAREEPLFGSGIPMAPECSSRPGSPVNCRCPSLSPRPSDEEREKAAYNPALWLGAAAAVVVAVVVAGWIYSRRPATLTDKDTIVLAEFTNRTGDPVFDETLRQGLAVQLQQSPSSVSFPMTASGERWRAIR